MKQLKELEQKILSVVHKNKELQGVIADLKKENEELKAKNKDFKAMLDKDAGAIESLTSEKDAMKDSIETILGSIKALEEAQQ